MTSVKESVPNDQEEFAEITNEFKAITDDPTKFLLVAPPNQQENIKSLLQKTYQACVKNDETSKHAPEILPELFVEGMDEEQLWQQLELRNNLAIAALVENSAKLLALREDKLEIQLDEDGSEGMGDEDLAASDNEPEEYDGELDVFSGEDEGEDEEPEVFQREKEARKKRNLRSSVVDDKFFKLREMEAFLEEEEAKEMRHTKRKTEDSIDAGVNYFAEDLGVEEDDDDDEDENPTYKDFFDENGEDEEENIEDTRKAPKDHFKDESSDEGEEEKPSDSAEENHEDDAFQHGEEDNDDSKNAGIFTKEALQPASSGSDDSEGEPNYKEEQPQSSFEIRQARLQQCIREYEAEVLGEKRWQLKGEVKASSRPANSLLEEFLEFESTVRPAPVVTEHTTRCLEDIIRQRIKDQAWDDPQPKMKPPQTPQDFRKQLILDQDKSKESLAQVYEKEYQKELNKLDPNRGDTAEEEPKEHKEIKQLTRSLFVKLDALSNFHFTPKPVAPEAKIITNTPAVAMEEVAPVAVSDAKLLAPEELYRGPKHELLGKTERNRTDKNRERRKKKQKQRVINRLLEEKSKKKQEQGIAPTKKEESAKLLKSLTKHRNVEKLNTTSDDQRALKSSKSFFSKLQDKTSAAGQAATAANAKKQKSTGKTLTAKRVKL